YLKLTQFQIVYKSFSYCLILIINLSVYKRDGNNLDYEILYFSMVLAFLSIYDYLRLILVGGVILVVLVRLICLRQADLKALIAYSSVAYIGIVLYYNYYLYTLIIAHGLCSSGLFCLANISYERIGRRRLIINKGILNFMPSIDGLGLVSYCLVIYFQNVKSFNAGILTALSNRIGDVALLLRIDWIKNDYFICLIGGC
uniref:NADH-ubiquinone oxidoreductase chain 4 n=1 Tax=Glossina morsitans morsitans TaxID=37546 RepID=A0A1B0FG04_GLOMM